MSAARPVARGLVARRCLASVPPPRATSASTASPASRLAAAAPTTCRQFHGSAPLAARRRPRFKSVPAHEMGLVAPKNAEQLAAEGFPEYSEQEKGLLRKIYGKEQMEALQAGEAAVDPRDLATQGRVRVDPYQLGYFEDFSRVDPMVDKRPKTKGLPTPKARFMELEEFEEDFTAWLRSFIPAHVSLDGLSDTELSALIEKHGPENLDILKFVLERSSLTGGDRGSNSALAPALMPKVPGVAGRYQRQVDPADDGKDPEGNFQDIKKQTNMSVSHMMNLTEKTIVRRFVTNQTRLGKIQSYAIMTIVGNRNGRLGLGYAKSTDASIAILKAKLAAIKNMIPIRRFEDRTIFGNVRSKVSGTVVELFARPPGFGLRVSHRIFEMCRAVGIRDLAARIPRSRNPMNSVKATYLALTNQPDPEAIAMGRGKKMVNVRKVYYGGAVL